MTTEEFNDKYDEWLEPRHYGLAINDEDVIKFLDSIFQDLTKIEGFSYSQIKLKFNMARFYADGISAELCSAIELRIDNLIQRLNS